MIGIEVCFDVLAWALLPPLIALLLAFLKAPAIYLAEHRLRSKVPQIIIPVGLLVFGGLIAISIDGLDLSELIFPDESSDDRLEILVSDLSGVYGIEGGHLNSLEGRIRTEFSSRADSRMSDMVAALFGISSAIYILLVAYSSRSEVMVCDDLKVVNSKNETLTQEVEIYKIASLSIENIVRAKFRRLKDELHRLPNPTDVEQRMTLIKSALSPDGQSNSYVICLHRFFSEVVFGLNFETQQLNCGSRYLK